MKLAFLNIRLRKEGRGPTRAGALWRWRTDTSHPPAAARLPPAAGPVPGPQLRSRGGGGRGRGRRDGALRRPATAGGGGRRLLAAREGQEVTGGGGGGGERRTGGWEGASGRWARTARPDLRLPRPCRRREPHHARGESAVSRREKIQNETTQPRLGSEAPPWRPAQCAGAPLLEAQRRPIRFDPSRPPSPSSLPIRSPFPRFPLGSLGG